jgi:hypothetical protein
MFKKAKNKGYVGLLKKSLDKRIIKATPFKKAA